MFDETHRDSTVSASSEPNDAEREARARLADPDVGSPEEGESTTDDSPGT
jgi:hypothetical protein